MIAGFLAPFRGFLHLLSRPALWRFAALPIVINVVLVVVLGWAYVRWFVPWTAGLIPGGDSFFAESGRVAAKVVLYVLTLPLALAIYLALASLLGGPFYEALCARVEREVLGFAAEPPARGVVRSALDGVRVELGNLLVAIVGGLLALFLPIVVPGAGVLIAAPIGWFLAAFDFIAYPFDRRAARLSAKLQNAFRHLPATLGFGLAVWILLVPLVTLPFVAPCAVAGAALLFPGGGRENAPLATGFARRNG